MIEGRSQKYQPVNLSGNVKCFQFQSVYRSNTNDLWNTERGLNNEFN